MIANRIASLPRSKGGLVERRWLHCDREIAGLVRQGAGLLQPPRVHLHAQRSLHVGDRRFQPGRDAFDRSVVLMDRGVQEMVAIGAAQVAHQIGENPLPLLAGFAGADDEVGLGQAIVAFQDAKEGTSFRGKALACRPVEHRSQHFSVAGVQGGIGFQRQHADAQRVEDLRGDRTGCATPRGRRPWRGTACRVRCVRIATDFLTGRRTAADGVAPDEARRLCLPWPRAPSTLHPAPNCRGRSSLPPALPSPGSVPG